MVANLASLLNASHTPRLVVKIGSALLVEDGSPRRAWLNSLVDDLADLRAKGTQIILVSSGAIALGAARLGLPRGAALAWRTRRPPPLWVRWRWRNCGPKRWKRMI